MDGTDLENPTSRGCPEKFSGLSSSRCSQKSAGQHSSPTVLPEKRSKSKSLSQKRGDAENKDPHKAKGHEQKTDVANEKSNFLGYEVYAGKLILDKKNKSPSHDHQRVNEKADIVDARITSKALIWGSSILQLDEVVSVSYSPRIPHFTVHAYPTKKSFFGKAQIVQKVFQFAASTVEEAILWITCFADQHIYINTLSNPAISSINQDLDIPISEDLFDHPAIKCKSPPRILVILNRRSGHGRSSKVFHEKAEPIFKGGSTALDVFAVEWIQSGLIHFGTTVSYYAFLSDGEISKA